MRETVGICVADLATWLDVSPVTISHGRPASMRPTS
jgi:hypothetical protein